MRFDRPQYLTVPQQFLLLKTNPICAGKGELRRGQLVWMYDAVPSPLGATYSVCLKYRTGFPPDVFIVQPDLTKLANGKKIPHVYSETPTELCLYFPGIGQWHASKRLDQFIVPWTALWLFFFEEWLISGEWKGGGKHPPKKK